MGDSGFFMRSPWPQSMSSKRIHLRAWPVRPQGKCENDSVHNFLQIWRWLGSGGWRSSWKFIKKAVEFHVRVFNIKMTLNGVWGQAHPKTYTRAQNSESLMSATLDVVKKCQRQVRKWLSRSMFTQINSRTIIRMFINLCYVTNVFKKLCCFNLKYQAQKVFCAWSRFSMYYALSTFLSHFHWKYRFPQ